eukprot:1161710-Pelagomonas_calceolata.AAC.13
MAGGVGVTSTRHRGVGKRGDWAASRLQSTTPSTQQPSFRTRRGSPECQQPRMGDGKMCLPKGVLQKK